MQCTCYYTTCGIITHSTDCVWHESCETKLQKDMKQYTSCVNCVSDLPGQRRLRSASTDRLVMPPFKQSAIGSRTFNVAAARTWNGLPEDVTSSPTLPAFRNRLKTHLFRHLILTLFLNLVILSSLYSGFEVALLLGPL